MEQSPGSARLPGRDMASGRHKIPVEGATPAIPPSYLHGSRRAPCGTLAAFSTILAKQPSSGGPRASEPQFLNKLPVFRVRNLGPNGGPLESWERYYPEIWAARVSFLK